MAKEAVFIQKGENIDYVASADIVSGQVVPLVNLCGIANDDIASGATGTLMIDGIVEIAAETGVAWAVGELIYWNDTDSKGTKTATDHVAMGFAVAVKASATATGRVKLQAKL